MTTLADALRAVSRFPDYIVTVPDPDPDIFEDRRQPKEWLRSDDPLLAARAVWSLSAHAAGPDRRHEMGCILVDCDGYRSDRGVLRCDVLWVGPSRVQCSACGALYDDARGGTLGEWRYMAPGWEHHCAGNHPQVGHFKATQLPSEMAKLDAMQTEAATLSSFVEWLSGQDYVIANHPQVMTEYWRRRHPLGIVTDADVHLGPEHYETSRELLRISESTEHLFARFFGIDSQRLEAERQMTLALVQLQAEQTSAPDFASTLLVLSLSAPHAVLDLGADSLDMEPMTARALLGEAQAHRNYTALRVLNEHAWLEWRAQPPAAAGTLLATIAVGRHVYTVRATGREE